MSRLIFTYRVKLIVSLMDMASRCRQTSLVKQLIVIAGFTSMLLVGFVLYRNPPQSQDIIRSVTSGALPLYTRYRESDQPQNPIDRNEPQIRRHGDGRLPSPAGDSLPSSSADSMSSHHLSVQGAANKEFVVAGPQRAASANSDANVEPVSQSNIENYPPTPVPLPSLSRELRVTSFPSAVVPLSEVQRPESGDQGFAPSSSENNRIPSINVNDRKQEGASVPKLPAVDTALSSANGAPLTADSQAQSAQAGQQQTRYIPHRCPPGFDKIADPEYENWFLKDVVQRSPVSSHSTSTSTFNDEILILTPISNSAKHLQRYFENICSLVYPHRLISIVLGEDSSTDNTVETAQQMVDQLGTYFKHVEFVKLPSAVSSL